MEERSVTTDAGRKTFPVWMTINIRAMKTVAELREALVRSGIRINVYASEILDKMVQDRVETNLELDLVAVTISQLVRGGGKSYKEILAAAKKAGLEECPAEAAVYALLQIQERYLAQDEFVVMGMKPLKDKRGDSRLFKLRRDIRRGDEERGCLWLDGEYSGQGNYWYANRTFVFVRPRQ